MDAHTEVFVYIIGKRIKWAFDNRTYQRGDKEVTVVSALSVSVFFFTSFNSSMAFS